MRERPAVPLGAAYLGARRRGAAALTDARVTATHVAAILRPGAGDALAPHPAGPRPPVAANALLAIPLGRSDARRDEQLATLARRPGDAWRPTLTAEQMTGARTLRRTQVGKSAPLSFVYRFVGRVGIGGTSTTAAAEGEPAPARDPLPCIDCG